MTYRLFIMSRAYSSWSLRGWLMLEAFGLPCQVVHADWPGPEWDAIVPQIAPARTVPALRIGDEADGIMVWDSLAIAEELAARHPEAGHWPTDPAARAAARSIAAEMHSGFSALRKECPMNIRRRYRNFEPSAETLADVERVRALWDWARKRFGGGGPYLFGAKFTAADAFYLPLASRLVTYGLPRGPEDDAYIDALHRLPAFRRWRAMAYANPVENPVYEPPLERVPGYGPGAEPLPARAIDPSEGASSVNAACPYSGKPVRPDSLAEIDGVVVGYCNTFCRDKSVADAEAWPATAKLLAEARG